MSGALVDWGAAARVAGAVSGGVGPIGAASAAPALDPGELEEVCRWALRTAGAHAGLGTPDAAPAPELIDRREWSRNALRTVAAAAAPLERSASGGDSEPGRLGAVTRRVLGAALGAEIGVAVGWAGRKVVGQYDLVLFGEPRPPRLLFVAENLENARRELEADHDLFIRWIALHEITHVIQFEQVPWLAEHVRALAGELLDGAAAGLEPGAIQSLGQRLFADPRALARRILQGELPQLLATPEQRALLDRLQATMATIEGHAEYVMDASGGELGPDLAEVRERMDNRRRRRRGLDAAIGRLLGMEMKLRQYRLGKAFCDEVVALAGADALAHVWERAEKLPTLAELEAPRDWLERTGAGLPQAA